MMKLSKIMISVFVIVLAITCITPLVVFANNEDYEMSGADWDVTDGKILAKWDKTEKSTSYVVKVYMLKNDKKKSIANTITTKGLEYDLTNILIEKGRGIYFFTVYPKNGGSKYKVTSDELEIDSGLLKQMKSYAKAKEEEDKKTGPVTMSKLELKITEINKPAGELKSIEFRDGNNYTVSNVQFSIPYEQWKLRDKITVTMKVEPKPDYMFGENMTIVCKTAESVSMTGSGQERQVTLVYAPYTVLAKPEGFYVTSDNMLRWNKVENATGYMVEVYIDDEKAEKKKVKAEEFDVSDYIDNSASLKIYSTNSANSYYYVSSSKYVIDNLDEFMSEHYLPGKFRKSGGRVRYIPEEYDITPGWNQLAGSWYYLDENGYAAGPGWWQDKDNPNDPNYAKGGSWYYFDENCRMLQDTVTPDGCKLDANGRWIQ